MTDQPEIHSAASSTTRQRRMAGALHDSGLRHGDRVALLTPGTTATVDLVLAASRSGLVPVPLDPRLTPRERAVVLEQVEPVLVVDDPGVLDELAGAADLVLGKAPGMPVATPSAMRARASLISGSGAVTVVARNAPTPSAALAIISFINCA